MPIIGMTRREDVENAAHRLVIGELRKGGPKTDPKKPGPDLDHWRFTSERPEVVAAFVAAYGAHPKIIEAYLPFPDMERNWITWYEEYDAGGMRHRCDGQTMYRWRKADGNYSDGEQPCPYFAKTKERTAANPGCKQVGRLFLVLPELIKRGYVGLVSMGTSSKNDLVSITTSLIDTERKAGKLSGILFSVARVEDTISTPAWSADDKAAGKRNRTKKYLISVTPQSEWVMKNLSLQAQQALALADGKPLQLEAPVDDADDDDDASADTDAEEGVFTPVQDDAPATPDATPTPTAAQPDDPFGNTLPPGLQDTKQTPPAKPAPPPATQQPVSTSDDARAAIIARLRKAAETNTAPADETLRKKLWSYLRTLTKDDEGRSKELLALIGATDAKSLTAGQANILIGWIKVAPDKDESGQVLGWRPTGPAISANEYAILFPPERGLFEGE